MTIAEQPDDIRNRALTAALVSDDGDKLLSEDNLLIAKPRAVLLLVSADTVDVQRLDIPRLVLPDTTLNVGLRADEYPVCRFKDNLF